MSCSDRPSAETHPLAIPAAWQAFVSSGEYARAQASIRAGGSERTLVRLLTARERSVIALIAIGQATGEIAETLHVSPSTVRSHVRNSMSKLQAHTRAQLVAVAMEGQRAPDVAQTDD